jgi:hypothetical protein
MSNNNIDDNYIVNNDVVLFDKSYDITEIDEYYDLSNSYYNKYPLNIDEYDAKIGILLDVMWYCNLLTLNNTNNQNNTKDNNIKDNNIKDNNEINSILSEFSLYIITNNPTYDTLLKHSSLNKLINALESVNINPDDSMFMAYYRSIRSLK